MTALSDFTEYKNQHKMTLTSQSDLLTRPGPRSALANPKNKTVLKLHMFYLAHPGAELMPPGEGEAEAHPVLLDEGLQPLPGPAPLIQYHLTCAGERVHKKIKLK